MYMSQRDNLMIRQAKRDSYGLVWQSDFFQLIVLSHSVVHERPILVIAQAAQKH